MSGSMLSLQEPAFLAGIGMAFRFKLTVPGIVQHKLAPVYCLVCYFNSIIQFLNIFNSFYIKDCIKSIYDFFNSVYKKKELHPINKQLAVKISEDKIRGQLDQMTLTQEVVHGEFVVVPDLDNYVGLQVLDCFIQTPEVFLSKV